MRTIRTRPTKTYTYDSNGNRTMDGYDTGPNNQLLDDGTYTYEYDDEGNRTRRVKTSDDSSTEYEWDFRNRLTRVTDKDAEENVTQVVEYTYDVFDRRISRAVDTTDPFDLDDAAIERYVLDDLNGVASFDGGNVVLDFVDPDGPEGEDEIALAKRYLYGNEVDQLLAQEDVTESTESADPVLWPLVDHLQTVRDLYRNDATSAEHYQYDSFGKVTDGDTFLTRYLYTSREIDAAISQQYNRARWYDSTVGRWLNEDPLYFESGSTSHYQYVSNMPTMSTDPTGHFPWPWPINGQVVNNSNHPVIIWTDDGYDYLQPGDSTSYFLDNADYVLWYDHWYKVGPNQVTIGPNGPVIITNIPIGDTSGGYYIKTEDVYATGPGDWHPPL